MDWILLSECEPELTERTMGLRPMLRVYFTTKAEPRRVREGIVTRILDDTKLCFDPVYATMGMFGDEVSHWMPRPLPEPPKGSTQTHE